MVNTTPQACKFYAQGRCRYGHACKWSHSDLAPRGEPAHHNHPRDSPAANSLPQDPASHQPPRTHRGLNSRPTRGRASAGGIQPQARTTRSHSGTSETFPSIAPLSNHMSSSEATQAAPVLVPPENTNDKKECPKGKGKAQGPLQRLLGNCLLVSFDAGLQVNAVTPIEVTASTIVIDNLPPRVTKKEICGLLHEFQESLSDDAINLTSLDSGDSGPNIRAVVCFKESGTAERARKFLDGHRLNDSFPSILSCKGLQSATTSLDEAKIECNWFAPSRIAFATFITAEAAAETARQQKQVGPRRVRLKATPGLRGIPTLLVLNLDINASAEQVRAALGPQCLTVSLKPPKYTASLEETTLLIRSLFEDVVGTKFDLISKPDDDRQFAVIRFENSNTASETFKKLKGVKYPFLGGDPLKLSLVYSCRFRVDRDIYTAISKELDVLKAKWNRDRQGPESVAQIRIRDDFSRGRFALINVHGERDAVARTKAAVQKLVKGEVVCDVNGQAIWDPALNGWEGRKIVKEAAAGADAYAFCDRRIRCVTLYGSPAALSAAREALYVAYTEFINNLEHSLSLAGWLAYRPQVLVERVNKIKEFLGVEGDEKVKVELHPRRRVTIQCPSADLAIVRRLLYEGTSEDLANPAHDENDCPVCFCPPDTNPVKLQCGHTYCPTCLKDYLRSVLSTRKYPIACCATTGDHVCGEPVSTETIECTVSKAEADDLIQQAFVTYIQQRPLEYSFCPTPDCPTVYPLTSSGKVISCPQCFIGVCTTCKAEPHPGMNCEAYKQSLVRETQFAQWKQTADVRPCPRCKADIEKNEGCMHMTCISCNTHMCWKCMGIFEENTVYGHIAICTATYTNPLVEEARRLERQEEARRLARQEEARRLAGQAEELRRARARRLAREAEEEEARHRLVRERAIRGSLNQAGWNDHYGTRGSLVGSNPFAYNPRTPKPPTPNPPRSSGWSCCIC